MMNGCANGQGSGLSQKLQLVAVSDGIDTVKAIATTHTHLGHTTQLGLSAVIDAQEVCSHAAPMPSLTGEAEGENCRRGHDTCQ